MKPNTKKTTPKSPPIIKLSQDKPSKLRSFLSLILATFALLFASLAIFTYWTERTLTDTDNFSAVVGPLAKSPEVQQLASQKLTEVITKQTSQSELAQALLGSVPPNINTVIVKNQINQQVQTEINKIITSEQFARLWTNATADLHAQLIKVISNPNDPKTTVISYQKTLKDVLALFKNTPLKQLSDADLEEGSGEVLIKADQLKDIKDYYQKLTKADTIALVFALVFGGLAILTANYRVKMVRKLALGLAISTGLIVLIALSVTNISVSGANTVEIKAGQAVLSRLLHELVRLSLIISFVSIGLVIVSSVIIHRHSKALK